MVRIVDSTRFSTWAPFVACALLSWLTAEFAWSLRPYFLLVYLLGALTAVFAVRVLLRTGLRTWASLGVALGLLIGEWRILESGLMLLAWALGGFAP
jgi:hypothetical protein